MNSETREGIGIDVFGATAAPAAEAQLKDGMSKIKYGQDEMRLLPSSCNKTGSRGKAVMPVVYKK